jgi:hypothetical protein
MAYKQPSFGHELVRSFGVQFCSRFLSVHNTGESPLGARKIIDRQIAIGVARVKIRILCRKEKREESAPRNATARVNGKSEARSRSKQKRPLIGLATRPESQRICRPQVHSSSQSEEEPFEKIF